MRNTRQRRVPALHTRAQMIAVRTARQRRGPRALVHRGRPRGWAHVTCGGGWKQAPKTRESTASRSPGGRGRRQPHTRPARMNRLPRPTNEARGARRPRSQPSASAAPAVAVLAGDNDASERRECAAGAARALPGCGWQLIHASSAPVSTRHHKLHAPSPVASPDAQVREGPGAAIGSVWSSFVHTCAALGPGAASCSRAVVRSAQLCSDGRARSLTHT
jgi:hypothetical protein